MRAVVAALGAVLLAAPAVVAAPAGPVSREAHAGSTAPTYFARVRLQIATTSDWTVVGYSPGQAVDWLVRRQQAAVGSWAVGAGSAGLSKSTAGPRKTLTVDLLLRDIDQSAPLRVTVEKGNSGATQVTMSVLAGNGGRVVKRLWDTLHGHGQANPVTARIPRAAVFSAHPFAFRRVDRRRLVLAFYYPWFHRYGSSRMADQPADPRHTDSAAGVRSMTAQAKAHGVNGFIVSWAGAGATGKQFRLALAAARRQHQTVTGYLESGRAAVEQPLTVERLELTWLVSLLRYSRNPAFLKAADGIPVVFVYEMDKLSAPAWSRLLGALHSRYHLRVHLVGDDATPSYLPFEWGLHNYGAGGSVAGLLRLALGDAGLTKGQSALDSSSAAKLYAATVMPGFDNRKMHTGYQPVIPRAGGERYVRSWQAAEAGQPDWMLVTSWNEWFEDTQIEPGQKTGSGALRLTARLARAWRRSTRRG